MKPNFLQKVMVSTTACVAFAVGSSLAYAQKPEITVRVANVMATSHDTSKAIEHFTTLVDEKSDGRIRVLHFPGGQLGSDKEAFEAAQMGMLDVAAGSSANVVTITQAFEVMHLPYIFNNLDEVHKAMANQEVRDQVNAELGKVGLHWLFTFDYGFRGINTSNRRVVNPEDVAGLKLRASRSPLEVSGIRAFGASAVTVDWPEVYNALKFKVVDGEGQPFGTLVSGKHHEVLNHTLENDWQYYGFVGLISQQKWDSYPEWAKAILQEAALESEYFHRGIWIEEDQKAREEFIAKGGEVIVPDAAQMAAWETLGKSVWADSGVNPALIEVVQTAATE